VTSYRRIAGMKTIADFRAHAQSVGAAIPSDDHRLAAPNSPLAQPLRVDGLSIGNRFAILPMEGWDGTLDGRASELTIRRWRRFGSSGAKLVWGGEAVAVRRNGRANPNQLLMARHTLADLAMLRETLVAEHRERFGATHDLLIGLQLTHSGRFAQPNEIRRPEPIILYHHPVLDRRVGASAQQPMSDDEIDSLIGDFVGAAKQAAEIGYQFVDIKHCHGYLGHEFLSAVDRPGRFGGSFENRTRFLREVVAGIRRDAPELAVGVRVSMVDWLPFAPGQDRTGAPERPIPESPVPDAPYIYAFGGDRTGLGIDLAEPYRLLDLLAELGIRLVCVTVGSPYYNPHRQRPATFPPSDGYMPPEDPLVGVAIQLDVTARLKAYRPDLVIVGSGYSYLQEWLPQVGQAVVRSGGADFVGLGRIALSYPDLPADVLAGKTLERKKICRTFSDCTTAPRNGLVSGCYPLDAYYKSMPQHADLARLKSGDSP
jgi:NADPH2 dehydrogenase